ncbi:MAG: hypothetical protein KGL20_03775 [Rhodospirillales bacterium]|nr:hypothetical protein [Rhodospirillales bacterium]MDE1882650.1 hypothetical protein [Rhodospirillales bacterium]MDE2458334.1 hypothetical protein [Rhodospirillales bacterium]
MRRRGWLLGVTGLFVGAGSAPAFTVPSNRRLAFEIWRKGSQIGTHVLDFVQKDGALTITIAVRIAVFFGPIRIFHYTMDAIEQWADGQVFHVESITNDDGTHDHMRADRTSAGLSVQGTGTAPYIAPPNALPATHWNIAELNGPWINPQNGKLSHPRITSLGEETVALAHGATARGTHYRVSGDADLDLWYATDQSWLSLSFTGQDGSAIRYLRSAG